MLAANLIIPKTPSGVKTWHDFCGGPDSCQESSISWGKKVSEVLESRSGCLPANSAEGSLIVETVFGIDGFGRFFYEAILNRDYNVIMFSTLAGSFLALIGYLIADICYTLLDPRVSLD